MAQVSDVTVIDIGSRSIAAYRAEMISDENFAVKSSCEIEYSGYMDGDWLVPDEIAPAFGKLIEKLERGADRIKRVYVGVPAQFCHVRTIPAGVTFPKAKRVSSHDIRDLMDHYDPFRGQAVVLHVKPLYYLTDRGERTLLPEKAVTSSLKAELSYIACEQEVHSFLTQILVKMGIKDVSFIQSEYASAVHLFTQEERDAGILLIDMGYLSTCVQFLRGDGVDEMKTFSLGGGFIPAGLSQGLNIPFSVARYLNARVDLAAPEDGTYSFRLENKEYSFPVAEINEMVKECIDYLASYLKKAVETLRAPLPSYTVLYLTGGGLVETRGAVDHLSKCLGREVRYIQSNVANYAKPYYSTAVGLIFEAIEAEKSKRFGFLKRLFA